jgi:hypothetical protein
MMVVIVLMIVIVDVALGLDVIVFVYLGTRHSVKVSFPIRILFDEIYARVRLNIDMTPL